MAVKHLVSSHGGYVTVCGTRVGEGNKPTSDISKVTCKRCKALHSGTHQSQTKGHKAFKKGWKW